LQVRQADLPPGFSGGKPPLGLHNDGPKVLSQLFRPPAGRPTCCMSGAFLVRLGNDFRII
jgi:hypothetical protein